MQASAHHLQIGPSALRWEGGVLTVDIAEVAVPWPERLEWDARYAGGVTLRGDVLVAVGTLRMVTAQVLVWSSALPMASRVAQM